jgi:hypothetical protein
MMSGKQKIQERSRERGKALAKDAVAETLSDLVPGLGPVAKWAYKAAKDRRQQRSDAFFRQLLTGEGPMSETECQKALDAEPLCSEVITRVMEDEEDDKVWAYAGLFRAFAGDRIPKLQRLRFLRCARDLTSTELLGMRSWHQSSKPLVSGPYVTFRITFEKQYREWFIQPELLQEEHPHVIEVLCRWGFIRRIHDRQKQAELPDGSVSVPKNEEHPVPGRFRLRVDPALALFVFVFACLAHGDGGKLGRASELVVIDEGRVDAIDFQSTRKAIIGPVDIESTETSTRQKLPGPTVDDFRYTVETQFRILSARLQSLPADPMEAEAPVPGLTNWFVATMGSRRDSDMHPCAWQARPDSERRGVPANSPLLAGWRLVRLAGRTDVVPPESV